MKYRGVLVVVALLLVGSLFLFLPKPSSDGPVPRSVQPQSLTSKGSQLALATRTNSPNPSQVRSAFRKRPWDRSFLSRLSQAGQGDAMSFELTGGEMASGWIGYLSSAHGEVAYLSGTLTQPEAGRFFFQKQTRRGVAGEFVGVVELPGSGRAYRIEPTGPGGSPELVERPLGEVLCRKLPKPLGLLTNQTAQIPPLNPGNFPVLPIPGYQNGISVLESLHGATAVVYLDFQGGHTPTWGGVSYAPAGVSNDQIREVFRRVAEDFMPFNINITTDLQIYENAPQGSRQRVLITPTTVVAPDAGGIAYVGSFDWTGETPCWVFETSGKGCAEACSHEIGHTLNLAAHEGQNDNGTHIGPLPGKAPVQPVGRRLWVSAIMKTSPNGAEASTPMPTTLTTNWPCSRR